MVLWWKENEMDKAFTDWLDEIENYGTRHERFLDEWDMGMSPERMMQWLYAAYTIGKNSNANDLST